MALTAAVALAAAWAWFTAPPPRDAVVLHPESPAVVTAGRAIYASHCAACHGAGLEGQPNWGERRADSRLPAPPQDASGHAWHHADEDLYMVIRDGPAAIAGGGYQSDMPGFAGVLDDAEIVAVLSFIKSTWPDEIRMTHDLINGRQPAAAEGR